MSKEVLAKLKRKKNIYGIWKEGHVAWEECRMLSEYAGMQQGRLRSTWN